METKEKCSMGLVKIRKTVLNLAEEVGQTREEHSSQSLLLYLYAVDRLKKQKVLIFYFFYKKRLLIGNYGSFSCVHEILPQLLQSLFALQV